MNEQETKRIGTPAQTQQTHKPDTDPENNSQHNNTGPAAEQRPAPARRNPRWFLIADPDFFDLLMEQDEQQ